MKRADQPSIKIYFILLVPFKENICMDKYVLHITNALTAFLEAHDIPKPNIAMLIVLEFIVKAKKHSYAKNVIMWMILAHHASRSV